MYFSLAVRTAALALISMGTANATTVIGSLTTASLGFVSGRSFSGQTFTVPSENVLTEWRFWVAGFLPSHGFTTDIGFAIYDWNGGLTCPCLPQYATSIPWPATTGVYDLTGLNVPLISGQSYAAVYSTGDYSGETIGIHDISIYANGQLLLGQNLNQLGTDAPIWTGFDTGFAGTFESSGPPTGAPEPSMFPMLTLIALIAAWRRLGRMEASERGNARAV
jgi:hypothetical protein